MRPRIPYNSPMPRRALLLLLFLPACSPEPTPVAPEPPGLHNLNRVSPELWSGGSPVGETGFIELKRLGVKTIISVDGATPEVALAEKHGLRYVHLPVGYDGIGRQRILELAKAGRDLPGPIYIHCHHGKHRGPAAAVAIRLCLDPQYSPEQAEEFLKVAGTDPRYAGLFQVRWTLNRPTPEELDRMPAAFPSVNRVAGLTTRMVEIDGIWDKLKAAKEAGWPNPSAAAADAVLLIEQYREVKRLPDSNRFAKQLAAAEGDAERLEQALRKADTKKSTEAFAASKAHCQSCHDGFRDRAK